MSLVIVSTPIGNLQDLSFRALEELRRADFVLCEDSRVSRALLSHYGVHKKVYSFHKFNEKREEERMITELKRGKKIALISDAGTPGICDPGARLIKRCHQENIHVSAIPGPCALITALTLYGMCESRFQFVGFLPKKEEELKKMLFSLLLYPGVSIAYDTPEHIQKTVELLQKWVPQKEVCIARELTKKFEEVIKAPVEKVVEYCTKRPLKGEIVFILPGEERAQDAQQSSPLAFVDYLEKHFSLSQKEALKLAALHFDLPKKQLYDALHKTS